jgi:ketosteroid isomerase-like protein
MSEAVAGHESVETLRELDQSLDAAISQRDATALDALLADDFIYTHSNGRSQNKSEFIEGIARREDPPLRTLSDIAVELHANIAVTRGNLDIRYYDSRPNLYMRYVRVYRFDANHWHSISNRTVYALDRNPVAVPEPG